MTDATWTLTVLPGPATSDSAITVTDGLDLSLTAHGSAELVCETTAGVMVDRFEFVVDGIESLVVMPSLDALAWWGEATAACASDGWPEATAGAWTIRVETE